MNYMKCCVVRVYGSCECDFAHRRHISGSPNDVLRELLSDLSLHREVECSLILSNKSKLEITQASLIFLLTPISYISMLRASTSSQKEGRREGRKLFSSRPGSPAACLPNLSYLRCQLIALDRHGATYRINSPPPPAVLRPPLSASLPRTHLPPISLADHDRVRQAKAFAAAVTAQCNSEGCIGSPRSSPAFSTCYSPEFDHTDFSTLLEGYESQ
ncbi:uncharacterized protein LOC122508315 [Leptopilina heterotoma]|uniref:uncharacterized protein LOC122508315 n=1 Tax=Leptopilina heterotoma TaxID=63436 RepID=UPI001CA97CC6|nr:uncharacterized protein LOC122508315 [Leptopilina heterotoma]